ncbi:MAG: hypothetical protein JWM20_855 [Patescibacteria group bacterium]|nr:hypothetical protein [Patescibacteria group bacterium]
MRKAFIAGLMMFMTAALIAQNSFPGDLDGMDTLQYPAAAPSKYVLRIKNLSSNAVFAIAFACTANTFYDGDTIVLQETFFKDAPSAQMSICLETVEFTKSSVCRKVAKEDTAIIYTKCVILSGGTDPKKPWRSYHYTRNNSG